MYYLQAHIIVQRNPSTTLYGVSVFRSSEYYAPCHQMNAFAVPKECIDQPLAAGSPTYPLRHDSLLAWAAPSALIGCGILGFGL